MKGTTDTSRDEYQHIQPEVGPWGERVFEIIRTESTGITCREIAMRLHKESGFVSARLNELEAEGRIERSEKRKDRWTGIDAYPWKVVGANQKPSYAGYRAWLKMQGVGDGPMTPKQHGEAYQQYLRSL